MDNIIEKENKMPTICFTGKMPDKRSVLEERAKSNGYVPLSSVTKDLDILVVEDPSVHSSKLQKAQKLGVEIISREKFYSITK